MGRERPGFEASGPLRTFVAAKKVTAATAREAVAAAHPAPDAKAALGRSHSMEAAEAAPGQASRSLAAQAGAARVRAGSAL